MQMGMAANEKFQEAAEVRKQGEEMRKQGVDMLEQVKQAMAQSRLATLPNESYPSTVLDGQTQGSDPIQDDDDDYFGFEDPWTDEEETEVTNKEQGFTEAQKKELAELMRTQSLEAQKQIIKEQTDRAVQSQLSKMDFTDEKAREDAAILTYAHVYNGMTPEEAANRALSRFSAPAADAGEGTENSSETATTDPGTLAQTGEPKTESKADDALAGTSLSNMPPGTMQKFIEEQLKS